jgi:hypothetical protein
MKPVDAVNEGGCSVYESSLGVGRWRIEHCVVGDIVADALFAYDVSNFDSEFVSAENDLAVRCRVLCLRFRIDDTGEEVDAVSRIKMLKNGGSGRADAELKELQEVALLESLVADAVQQFDECSVPLIRRQVWESHPRNPANTAEQSAAARRVARDPEAGI